MTRFANRFAAACAALLLTVVSIGAVVTVPAPTASSGLITASIA